MTDDPPADPPVDLLHTPLPDRAHEALRQAALQAVDNLAEQLDRLSSAFLLLSVTADFSQATLLTVRSAKTSMAQMQTTAGQLAQQISAVNTRAEAALIRAKDAEASADLLQTQMADVLDRLAALENPPAPEAAP